MLKDSASQAEVVDLRWHADYRKINGAAKGAGQGDIKLTERYTVPDVEAELKLSPNTKQIAQSCLLVKLYLHD